MWAFRPYQSQFQALFFRLSRFLSTVSISDLLYVVNIKAESHFFLVFELYFWCLKRPQNKLRISYYRILSHCALPFWLPCSSTSVSPSLTTDLQVSFVLFILRYHGYWQQWHRKPELLWENLWPPHTVVWDWKMFSSTLNRLSFIERKPSGYPKNWKTYWKKHKIQIFF